MPFLVVLLCKPLAKCYTMAVVGLLTRMNGWLDIAIPTSFFFFFVASALIYFRWIMFDKVFKHCDVLSLSHHLPPAVTFFFFKILHNTLHCPLTWVRSSGAFFPLSFSEIVLPEVQSQRVTIPANTVLAFFIYPNPCNIFFEVVRH